MQLAADVIVQYALTTIIAFLISVTAFSQGLEEAEEIPVTLQVQHVGSIELTAVISGEEIYLPLTDVFNFLQLRNIPSVTLDSISGFFIHPNSVFLFDGINRKIFYAGQTHDLSETDVIKTETNLYLKAGFFQKVFGLACAFNFRNFTVSLTSTIELPVMREVRLAFARANIDKLKGIRKADTILKREYRHLNAGVADWAVQTATQSNGLTTVRANVAAGGMVAGGEAHVALNYSSKVPVSARQFFYRWRLVDNERSFARQLALGKFYTQSISTIYSPVIGLQLSNIPTTSRKSFGTYRISRKTEPGWTVELYVNNVLVNSVKADASGFYTFEVPLVYGNSNVTLHFYGPWGEERTQEENILIPFQFVPKKEFQYTLSSGIVEDGKNSAYARLNANYGLGSHVTVVGGWEHLSSILSGTNIPFVTSAVRLGSRVLLTSEYAFGVRSKTVLNYSLPSSMQVEVNYIKYEKTQSAVKFNYQEERKFIVSLPLKTGNLFTFSRLSLNQYILPKQRYSAGELLLSAVYRGISTNLTNNIMYYDKVRPYIYSNFSLSLRTRKGLRVTPVMQYEYMDQKVTILKAEVEKSILKKAYLSFSGENNFRNKISTFMLGFRYDLSFAQAAWSIKQSNNITTLLQSARGSVMYDHQAASFVTNRMNNVGKAGIIIIPFLDINGNGKRDAGEGKVSGLNLHVNGRVIQRSQRDSSILITGLEAYTKYLLELNPASFESISWQLKKRAIEITAEPNQMKLVEIPVYVSGEVSGNVYFKGSNGQDGQSGMIICIYDKQGAMVARTISEPDGYFSYLGLSPGTYSARMDPNQLIKLRLQPAADISFTIKPSREGDIVDGLEFVLTSAITRE